MADNRTIDPQPPQPALEDLTFLQNEGFDLLATYRMIRDPALRRKVREPVIAIVEAQPED